MQYLTLINTQSKHRLSQYPIRTYYTHISLSHIIHITMWGYSDSDGLAVSKWDNISQGYDPGSSSTAIPPSRFSIVNDVYSRILHFSIRLVNSIPLFSTSINIYVMFLIFHVRASYVMP